MSKAASNTSRRAVKKAVSLPADLARATEALAREQGKTVSGVIQDALRAYRADRLRTEFRELQGYWSRRAREKGVLTQRDLDRLLRR